MLLEPFLENFFIYTENISLFYLICASVSFLAVWFTRCAEPTLITQENEEEKDVTHDVLLNGNNSDESIHSKMINTLDRKVLIKSIESTLSSDDRAKESEVEKRQLMDILEIMKNDEKFRLTTMEELQEQLKLYRE